MENKHGMMKKSDMMKKMKEHEKSESSKKEKSESATERAQKPSGRHSNVHTRTSMTRRYKTA